MKSSELPAGWIIKPLSEVAEVKLGRQRSPKNHSGPFMRPYLRAANVTWAGLSLHDVKEMNFGPSELETFRLELGDVLVAEASGSRSEVGKAAIWRGEIQDCCFQNTLLRVRSRGPLPEFLLLILRHAAATGQFGNAARGVGIHHLGAKALSEWPVVLPPEEEQRAIIAEIDKQMPRLDAAVVALHRTRTNLRVFKSSMFHAACTGQLRLPSSDRSVGSNRWTEATLGELLREPLRNGHSAKRSSDFSGTRTLTLTAVTQGDFSLKNTKMTIADKDRVQDLWIQPGDIFIERSNTAELVGTARMYRGPKDFAVFPDLLIRARVDESKILPSYLEVVLQARQARQHFQRRAQGIAGSMPKIDQQAVRELPLNVPPIDLQEAIVEEVERCLTLIDRLERQVTRGIRQSKSLRQSILSKTLRGPLTFVNGTASQS